MTNSDVVKIDTADRFTYTFPRLGRWWSVVLAGLGARPGNCVDETRRIRVNALPAALRRAIGRDCALVVHSDRVDECRYDIFEVRGDRHGVVVSRQCWWFDEDVQSWSLDDSSEWFLSAEQAMQLGIAIQHAGLPVSLPRAVGASGSG